MVLKGREEEIHIHKHEHAEYRKPENTTHRWLVLLLSNLNLITLLVCYVVKCVFPV